MFDFIGQQRLVKLTGKSALIAQIKVFGHLLRDGAGARLHAARSDIADNGTRNTEHIHTPVLIKALVFRCNHGIFQVLRKIIDFSERASLLTIHPNDFAV